MSKQNGGRSDDRSSPEPLLSDGALQAQEAVYSGIAKGVIAQDMRDVGDAVEEDEDPQTPRPDSARFHDHSMAANFRRPSFAAGPRPFFGTQVAGAVGPVEQGQEAAINEERSLLRDNQIIPPKHPRSQSVTSGSSGNAVRSKVSVPGFSIPRFSHDQDVDEEAITGANGEEPSETTALLGAVSRDPEAPYGGEGDPEDVDKKWEEAVLSGKIKTSWQREAKVLARYAAPGVLTFLLQYSLTMTSIFTVGHIGKKELGAVSLGGMTANITGYVIYFGCTTSLDTLCAQAYGSGKKKLVGLQLQRMVYFLWAVTIPIAIVWAAGSQILAVIIPDPEIARLAGLYLKVLILGAPAFALFEASKRYVQAQGRFEATTYVLLICAPLNVFLHWLFVWVRVRSQRR